MKKHSRSRETIVIIIVKGTEARKYNYLPLPSSDAELNIYFYFFSQAGRQLLRPQSRKNHVILATTPFIHKKEPNPTSRAILQNR